MRHPEEPPFGGDRIPPAVLSSSRWFPVSPPQAGDVRRPGQQAPTLGLAADLVLLGHDPATGRPRIPPGTQRAAVVGGLLADLFLSGRLCLAGGGVQVRQDAPAPVPREQRIVCERVRARPGRDIAHWVGHLDTVPRLVNAGLAHAGILRQIRVRHAGSLWRRIWALAPAGPAYSRVRALDLGLVLARNEPLTGRVLALAGLVDATGLLPVAVRAAGPTAVIDPSAVTPVRARIRDALHRATTPDLALICAAVAGTAHGPDPDPTR